MKVRITLQGDDRRAYYVTSGDRRRPAVVGRSGVPLRERKAVIADLISEVDQRMRSGTPVSVQGSPTLGH